MIVTACLVWWNESPSDLEACVRGIATVADRLVAVDGSYSRYPGATVRSAVEQEEVIRDTASQLGLDHSVVVPDRLWAGQVEKRAYALARASEGSDWVAVVDADWRISGDREKVRDELEHFLRRSIWTVAVEFHTPLPDPLAEGWNPEVASAWHTLVAGTTVDMAHIFRALPELTCEGRHWVYSAKPYGKKVWMWGKLDRTHQRIMQKRLESPYRIDHMTLHRTPEQVMASRAFLNDRIWVLEQTGQEDDLPELRRPIWDYETVPYTRGQP